MSKHYTHCRDRNKTKIYYGDILDGSYGIPPVYVKGKAGMAKGKPVFKTPYSNPKVCPLRTAVYCLDLEIMLGQTLHRRTR